MHILRTFQTDDTDSVIELWRRCDLLRPWNDPHKDIFRKISIQPELFLVLENGDCILGCIMAGYDGHRGWLNYLAVDPDFRQKGYGRQLVQEAANRLHDLGCPKINIQVRKKNVSILSFYRKLGFVDDPVISLGKRLEQDSL